MHTQEKEFTLQTQAKEITPIKGSCTIDELFQWYMGTPEWANDWQTTNCLCCIINEKEAHTQEDNENGATHLKFLQENRNESIEYEYFFDAVLFEITFEIKDRTYLMDSSTEPFLFEEAYDEE